MCCIVVHRRNRPANDSSGGDPAHDEPPVVFNQKFACLQANPSNAHTGGGDGIEVF